MGLANNQEVLRILDEYIKLDPRRYGSTRFEEIGSDVDVDLWVEDSYLVGLTQKYLSGRKLKIKNIKIDGTIDARLAEVARNAKAEQADHIYRYVNYRARMLELAQALSAAVGVSIVVDSRDL
jgi:hypothetical protein